MRRHLTGILVVLFFLGAPAAAQIAETDRETALKDALRLLKTAPDADAAKAAEDEVWALWFIGPDADATVRLKDAVTALQGGALAEAHWLLDALVEEAPDFAEAWNQRAFVKFLGGDLHGSLADIAATLKREPRHFGALAGRAQIEMALGRPEAAKKTMGELAAIHPWMARWSPIPAEPPPPEPGERL